MKASDIKKVGINYVMVKTPRTYDELRSDTYTHKSGLIISHSVKKQAKQIDAPDESAGHNTSSGTVVGVGELQYKGQEDFTRMKWKTKNELKKGDQIVFYYGADCWETGEFLVDGQDVYFFIRYHNVYFAIRDGKIVCVNGYNLVEPIKENAEEKIGNIVVPEMTREKTSKKYGYVRHVAEPLEEIAISTDEKPVNDEVIRLNGTECTGYGVKENDFVVMEKFGAKPILYATQNYVGNFYATHRFAMAAVIEDPAKITL